MLAAVDGSVDPVVSVPAVVSVVDVVSVVVVVVSVVDVVSVVVVVVSVVVVVAVVSVVCVAAGSVVVVGSVDVGSCGGVADGSLVGPGSETGVTGPLAPGLPLEPVVTPVVGPDDEPGALVVPDCDGALAAEPELPAAPEPDVCEGVVLVGGLGEEDCADGTVLVTGCRVSVLVRCGSAVRATR